MRSATDLLSQYAAYHRDRRNIVSHFVGVPMIVFAVGVLLARPAFPVGGVALTPAWVAFALAARLVPHARQPGPRRGRQRRGGRADRCWRTRWRPAASAVWLAWGVGFFVVGWLIQFVGHWYEGRKPAFVDDLVGLLVGPMFVVAEAHVRARLEQAAAGRDRAPRRPDRAARPGEDRLNGSRPPAPRPPVQSPLQTPARARLRLRIEALEAA